MKSAVQGHVIRNIDPGIETALVSNVPRAIDVTDSAPLIGPIRIPKLYLPRV